MKAYKIPDWTDTKWTITGPTAAAEMTMVDALRVEQTKAHNPCGVGVVTKLVANQQGDVVAIALGMSEEDAKLNANLIASVGDMLRTLQSIALNAPNAQFDPQWASNMAKRAYKRALQLED